MDTLLGEFIAIQRTLTWVLIIQSGLLVVSLGIGACTAYLTYQVYRDVHTPRAEGDSHAA